jgi:hypothetical protein
MEIRTAEARAMFILPHKKQPPRPVYLPKTHTATTALFISTRNATVREALYGLEETNSGDTVATMAVVVEHQGDSLFGQQRCNTKCDHRGTLKSNSQADR